MMLAQAIFCGAIVAVLALCAAVALKQWRGGR